MKKFSFILSAIAVATAGCFVGCSDNTDDFKAKGRLFVHPTVVSDVKVESRAADDLNEQVVLYISGKEGLIRKYKGISSIPTDGIPLLTGNYVAEAWAGDSVSASWDARFYKAYYPFAIDGSDLTINLRCTIANVLAAVQYSDDVDGVLTDYTLTVSHPRGSLTFEGKDKRVASFMMPSTATDLDWKLEGTDIMGNPYSKEGVIKNVKPATQYNLIVSYTPESTEIGGGYLNVVVDPREVVVNHEITIIAPPRIQGVDFDIKKPLMAEPGNVGHRALFITAAAELNSVILDFDELDELLGITDVDGSGINLLKMQDEIKAQAEAAGLDFTYEFDEANEIAQMKINFSETLMNSLTEGEHVVEISASIKDRDKEKTSEEIWVLKLTNEPVSVAQVPASDVWATKATVSGTINKEDVTDIEVRYREAASRADGDWNSVPATVTGNTFTAEITDLQPGLRYEYYAVAADFETHVQTFTTEAAAQIPNGDFENWCQPNKAIIPAAEEASLFWDSGNHGSTSISASDNITTSSTDYVHSGQYSARLESRFVGVGTIGKLAAGNIFVGKYLRTDGTNGILGWGRPFTSRPKALKGYVKYTPATITDESSSVSALKKGDMDQGKIYIALLTDELTNANDSKITTDADWPVIIKTNPKTLQLFDHTTATNVIAYGEMWLKEATSGDGMIEFTIPLEYSRNDIVPSNIMIVCSASAYGDYFVGGRGSVMYIDDFTLEY